MLKVGLTGGTGAGKTTVAARMAELGAVVVDADALAREVVAPGSEGLAAVVAAFGDDVLAPDGSLDRPALAAVVFADAERRRALEGITHPRIQALTAERVAAAPSDAVVVHDVPLLVERSLGDRYHLVVVVTAPEDVRVARLVESRGMSADDARARVRAQASDEQRRAAADVLLPNTAAPEAVLADVDALWRERLVPFEAALRRGVLPERRRRARHAVAGPADARWADEAARLVARVRAAAVGGGVEVVRVDHVGPTAVPGTPAPDELELQLVVRGGAPAAARALSGAGFLPREPAGVPEDGAAVPELESADPGRHARLRVHEESATAWQEALDATDALRVGGAADDAGRRREELRASLLRTRRDEAE